MHAIATPRAGIFRIIGEAQTFALRTLLRGEEREFFRLKLQGLSDIFERMPLTGQTAGEGTSAIIYLHYFTAGADFYILERDIGTADDEPEDFQSQAFGLADIFQDGGEIGYISIPEILAAGAELDLHWEPKTIAALRAES